MSSKQNSRPLLALVAVLSVFALARSARAATPEKEHVAVAGNFGLYAPFQSDYSVGYALEGNFEYYAARRLGIRGTAGYTRATTNTFGHETVSLGYLLGSGVYNWEFGKIHPFALGGIGVYAVSPAVGSSTARVGVHVGGGAEFFLTRRTSIPVQGTFHFLGSVADQKQSFFNATAGIRYYF